MIVSVDEVKEYLRIDGAGEETFLSSLIFAAEAYIENATGVAADENNNLHRLAINLLVSHWYENREVLGKADKLAYGLESILLQIKYCGEVI
jgi:uncharacterized phage protein (predicted DNA packaging)